MKFGFLLYDSRSGSTFLAALLNSYSSIDVSLESAFASRIMELNDKEIQNPEIILSYLNKEIQFTELGLDNARLQEKFAQCEDRKSLIFSIVQELFHHSTAELKIIKHPPYKYLKLFKEWFPELKYINILRDGRAVHNSKKQSISITSNVPMSNSVHKSVDRWMEQIKALNNAPGVVSIRYEDLISNSDATINKLLDELKIENRNKTGSPSDYRAKIGSKQKTLHKNVKEKAENAFAEKWQFELTKNEIMLYEDLAGGHLKNYGYQLIFDEERNIGYWAFRMQDYVKMQLTFVVSVFRSIFTLGDFNDRLRRKLS